MLHVWAKQSISCFSPTRFFAITALCFLSLSSITANAATDTLNLIVLYERPIIRLDEVEFTAPGPRNEVERMPSIQGTVIYSGKKNEVIRVATMDADLTVNNPRQIFGKVPGVSIWENDGSGIQLGIATRGLSPNRSWEFNVRQNGYDISSEVFGYPEAYFTPPMEAVERIELIRGAASLAYGPQFGGLLNFVIKSAPKDKPFQLESQQTAGSYGLFNSFNAIGGTRGNVSYYAYFHHRRADGWRQNSRYNINTGYVSVNVAVTPKLNLGFQYTGMNYESQQPGGLTDALFDANPQQSFRQRNWFSTPWNVLAFTANYDFNENTRLSMKTFATIAERNSVGFMGPINVADTFNTTLGSFNPRQVDRDLYFNYGTEIRFLTSYNLLNQKSTLAAGVRAYRGETGRLQLGVGTPGYYYDIAVTPLADGRDYARDLLFTTYNYAVFVENLFRIGERLSITPGLRYEIINSAASGHINATPAGVLADDERQNNVFLFGLGTEFKTTETTNIYANFSQAFRPVMFADITPSAVTDVIDPELKDVSGYNFDFGFRGTIQDILCFDIGGFYMYYDNRIGTISRDGAPFRTNIGTSVSKGAELFVELDPLSLLEAESRIGHITLFTSFAYIDAEYTSWNNPAIADDPARAIQGKRVENAPRTIARYGINYRLGGFSASFQLNNTGDVFTDAANTVEPNATGTIGQIAGFTVMDASITYNFLRNYNIRAGVNNLTDEMYSTRRAGGYPGPGLLPANGRTFFIGLGVKL